MNKIVPLRFIITGNKREDGDCRELDIFLYTKSKEQQIETLRFIKKYLKIERIKPSASDVSDKKEGENGKR